MVKLSRTRMRFVFSAMETDSVAKKHVSASLKLFFATDSCVSATETLIKVTLKGCFTAKTLRSFAAIHCFVSMQYCFFRKQHDSVTETVYSVIETVLFCREKSFCINEEAPPALKQHCSGSKQHCFFAKQSGFVTKILWSVPVKPISEAGQPCFLPETPISVTQTLGSGTDSTVSEAQCGCVGFDVPWRRSRLIVPITFHVRSLGGSGHRH